MSPPPLTPPARASSTAWSPAFRRIDLSTCIEQMPCERSLRNADSGASDMTSRVPAATPTFPNLIAVPEVR
jgi:hypothetical protein